MRVLIKDIQGKKITLNPKSPEANPWVQAAGKYAVGNVVVSCVARTTDSNTFVELKLGIDVFLHVSQISRKHVEKPASMLRVDEEIEARMIDFNEADCKIGLSVKAMMAPTAWDLGVTNVDIDVVAQQIEG